MRCQSFISHAKLTTHCFTKRRPSRHLPCCCSCPVPSPRNPRAQSKGCKSSEEPLNNNDTLRSCLEITKCCESLQVEANKKLFKLLSHRFRSIIYFIPNQYTVGFSMTITYHLWFIITISQLTAVNTCSRALALRLGAGTVTKCSASACHGRSSTGKKEKKTEMLALISIQFWKIRKLYKNILDTKEVRFRQDFVTK